MISNSECLECGVTCIRSCFKGVRSSVGLSVGIDVGVGSWEHDIDYDYCPVCGEVMEYEVDEVVDVVYIMRVIGEV